jgi:hypothetical protein
MAAPLKVEASTPLRVEESLFVVVEFKDQGVEYRPGDRAKIRHRSIRLLALANPDWFRMEYETAPVDLDWLRELEARAEEDFRAAKRAIDGRKAAGERALRDELKQQNESQPRLERKFRKQDEERARLEEERREQAERQEIEKQIQPHYSGFQFESI